MKTSWFLPPAIVLVSMAAASGGVSAASDEFPTSPGDPRSWFLGSSAAYLFEYREPMLSLHGGVRTPWSPLGWSTACDLEVGLIEDDNESEIPLGVSGIESDLQMVPVTLNVKFERALAGNFGVYFGAGAGAVFSELIVKSRSREQDTNFAAQIFAGMNLRIGENSEIRAGGRWLHFDDSDFYDLGQDWALELGFRWHF